MTKIKACGLTREREIDYVNQYLPDYAGFVLCFPNSRRSISPERAEQLIRLPCRRQQRQALVHRTDDERQHPQRDRERDKHQKTGQEPCLECAGFLFHGRWTKR